MTKPAVAKHGRAQKAIIKPQNLEAAGGELERAAEMAALGRVAIEVVHELNNLLGAALGYLQLARETDNLSSPPVDYLIRIEERIRQATRLVGEILEFGTTPRLSLQPVLINNLLREATDLSLISRPGEKIRIDYDLSSNLPPVLGDPLRLSQVFLNLFKNAQEAMPLGGEIKIKSYHQGGWVHIIIADTGQGIMAEDLPHIFTQFFTTRPGKGLGMGLAISQRIIEEHGGTIRVESKNEKGTKFLIRLPAAPEIFAR